MGTVIVIAILVVGGWLLLALPWRRRQRAHAAMQDDVVEGDEIITAGGLHAVVRDAGERELRIEIAPGVVVTLDRRAVAAVAEPLDDEEHEEDEAGQEPVDGDAPAGGNDPVAN
jgi:preprotein translocase subunit YajC